MATVETRATIDDLYRVEGKAELIGGRIVELPMTGSRPNEVAVNILVNLRTYAKSISRGKTYSDAMGFSIPELASGRESFSPDVAYYFGPMPANEMRFV